MVKHYIQREFPILEHFLLFKLNQLKLPLMVLLNEFNLGIFGIYNFKLKIRNG